MESTTSEKNDNHNGELISIAIVFLFVSFVGLVCRMLSKRMKRASLVLDDFLLLLAFFLCIVESCLIIWASLDTALGRHVTTVTLDQAENYLKVLYAIEFLQPSLLALAKLSVLLLLRHIFITPTFRITTTVLMSVVGAWLAACYLTNVFVCWPIRSRWNPNLQGLCKGSYYVNIIIALPWIVTDVAILIAPLPMIRKLQMPIRQKIALAGIFLVGSVTCLVSIIRYRYGFYAINDPTYDVVPLINWNIIEANVTVLCVSLIASKPVFIALFPESLPRRLSSCLKRSLKPRKSIAVTRSQETFNEALRGSESRQNLEEHHQAQLSTNSIPLYEQKNAPTSAAAEWV